MKIITVVGIAIVCTLNFLTVTEAKYRKVPKNTACQEYKDIITEIITEQKCGAEENCEETKEKTCDFHWVEIPGGGKKWQEDPTTCKDLPKTVCKPGCRTVHKRVSRSVTKWKPMGDKSVPCFSMLGEDQFGIPKMEMMFPDGTTDELKIGRFSGDNSGNSFIGSLKTEGPFARVAMTRSDDGVEDMTIMSFRSGNSSMFRHFPNGMVEMIAENKFPDKALTGVSNDERYGSYNPYYPRQKRQQFAAGALRRETPVPEQLRARCIGDPNTVCEPMKLNLVLVNNVDSGTLPLKRLMDVGPHMQTRYCHPSLPTQIVLNVIAQDRATKSTFKAEIPTDANGNDINSQSAIHLMQEETKEIIRKARTSLDREHLVAYVTEDKDYENAVREAQRQTDANEAAARAAGADTFVVASAGSNTAGIGIVGSVCDRAPRDGFKGTINEYSFGEGDIVSLAETIAHEVGHNLGMHHDFDKAKTDRGDPPERDATDGQDPATFNSRGGGSPIFALEKDVPSTGKCEVEGNIMNYRGGRKTMWSECSGRDFLHEYNVHGFNDWCLERATEAEGKAACEGNFRTVDAGK